MRVATGSFVGNGDQQFINVGFEPELIVIKSSNATPQGGAFWVKNAFTNRTLAFSAIASLVSGVMPHENGFFVGSNQQVNDSGQTLYWLAIADNGDGVFDAQAWAGNATAGRVLSSNLTRQIQLAWVKRDSTADGVFRSYLGTTCSTMDNNSQTDNTNWITALGVGTITVGAGANVNEMTGTSGEGTNGAFFAPNGGNCQVFSYTGDGTTGRSIALPFAAKAVITFRQDAVSGPRFFTDKNPGTTSLPLHAAAPQANDGAISGSSLVVGSNAGGINANGVLYHVLCFGQDTGTTTKTPDVPACAVGSGRKVIYLPGRNVTSYINCGASNATLQISGAISIEFMAQTFFAPGGTSAPSADQCLLARSGGVAGGFATAPNFSYAITEYESDSSALGWQSQWNITPGQFLDLTDADGTIAHLWRTGVGAKSGRFFHLLVTCSATGGKWNLYINGKLVKNRSVDMVSVFSLQNIVSTAGHTTVIGGRYNGTAVVSFARMLFALARIYNVELTPAQVLARYQRAALGLTSVADVTTGLAEEWDAANARGNSLPATVNSANNGTIVGGTLLTL